MKKTEKITSCQLLVMIFIGKVFFFMMYTPKVNKSAESSVYMLSQILALPLIFLTLLPFYYMEKNEKGHNLLTLTGFVNKNLGKIVSLAYWGYLIFVVVNSGINFDFYLTSAVYPESKSRIFIVTLILSALYCALIGIEPLARFSGFVIGAVVIGGIFIFLPLLKEVNLSYVHLPDEIKLGDFLSALYLSVVSKNEFALLYILNDSVKGNISKGVSKYVIGEIAFFEMVTFFTLAVFGSNSKMVMFPLYMLSNMAKISVLERTDALHAVIWVFVAFVKVSLFLIAASKILSEQFNLSYKKAVFLNTAVSMIISIILSKSFTILYNIRMFAFTGILFMSFSFIIPAVVVLLSKFKKSSLKRSA